MPRQYDEIECKFLEVDIEDLRSRLGKLGAKSQDTRLFRRYVFDYPDLRLNKQSAWVSVRDESDQVTISYKQRRLSENDMDEGMTEIELVVDDFDRAVDFFTAIGLKPKFYEENRRSSYELDGVEIDIDEWPLIPPYVELESQDWESLRRVADKLGFNWSDRQIYSTQQVYAKYGIREADYQVLTFAEQIKK